MPLKILLFISIILVNSNAFAEAPLNYQKFFGNSIQVGIPSDFIEMDATTAAQRYPDSQNRPKKIFMSQDGAATIALNFTPNQGDRQSIIHFFRDIKNDIRANYPDNRFLMTDVIRNRSLALIEYTATSPAGDKLYNFMAFRYVGDNFFFFNFTCPEGQMDKYQQTAREITQDIELVGKSGY